MTEQQLVSESLPWHTPQWEFLTARAATDNLGHSYLLHGPEGLGKRNFALRFAHYLLCRSPLPERACGNCHACHLNIAGSHPDLLHLAPKDSKAIKIDQVRQAIDFTSKTSQEQGYKIVILEPVEAMNVNSANALLKALEEPMGKTLFLLITHQPGLILATIRSRCQGLQFQSPAPETALNWLHEHALGEESELLLAMANGAPLKARALADSDLLEERHVLTELLEGLLTGRDNISQGARLCQAFEVSDIVDTLILWVADILRYKQTAGRVPLTDKALKAVAEILDNREQLMALHQFHDKLTEARHALQSSANPNGQMILEDLLFSWSALQAPSLRMPHAS